MRFWFNLSALASFSVFLCIGCSKGAYYYQPDRLSSKDNALCPGAAMIVDESRPENRVCLQFIGVAQDHASLKRCAIVRYLFDNKSTSTWKFSRQNQNMIVSSQELLPISFDSQSAGQSIDIAPGPTQVIDFKFPLPDSIHGPKDLEEFTLKGEINVSKKKVLFSRRFIRSIRKSEVQTGLAQFWDNHHEKSMGNKLGIGSPQNPYNAIRPIRKEN
jgi:hypothetical protein